MKARLTAHFFKMRRIDYIVIHCADTLAEQQITAADVDAWHKARGWKGIGYHFFIRRNGLTEPGRMIDTPGAHVRGYNSHSIGICYAGGRGADGQPEDNRTPEQLESMVVLVKTLKKMFPEAEVLGHRDFEGVTKACPSFDVKEWVDDMMIE